MHHHQAVEYALALVVQDPLIILPAGAVGRHVVDAGMVVHVFPAAHQVKAPQDQLGARFGQIGGYIDPGEAAAGCQAVQPDTAIGGLVHCGKGGLKGSRSALANLHTLHHCVGSGYNLGYGVEPATAFFQVDKLFQDHHSAAGLSDN